MKDMNCQTPLNFVKRLECAWWSACCHTHAG